MTAGPIRVVLASARVPMRERLPAAVEALPGAILVGEVATGEQVIAAAQELEPDVIGLDMEIPGVHAIIVTHSIVKLHLQLGIVAWIDLSSGSDLADEQAQWMQQAGACCCIDDQADQAELERAIAFAASGTVYLSAHLAQRAILTRREFEILLLIAAGWTNAQIAKMLKITPSTVHSHAMRISRMLGIAGRAEAVARGRELGLGHGVDASALNVWDAGYHTKRQELYRALDASRWLH